MHKFYYATIACIFSLSQLTFASDNERILEKLDSIDKKIAPSRTKTIVWYTGLVAVVGVGVYSAWKYFDFLSPREFQNGINALEENAKENLENIKKQSAENTQQRKELLEENLNLLKSDNEKKFEENGSIIDSVDQKGKEIKNLAQNQYNNLNDIDLKLEQETKKLNDNNKKIITINSKVMITNKQIETSIENTIRFNICQKIFASKNQPNKEEIQKFNDEAKNFSSDAQKKIEKIQKRNHNLDVHMQRIENDNKDTALFIRRLSEKKN